MRKPKSVKTYIKHLKIIAAIPITGLNGYHKLNEQDQLSLGVISADIENSISELENKL